MDPAGNFAKRGSTCWRFGWSLERLSTPPILPELREPIAPVTIPPSEGAAIMADDLKDRGAQDRARINVNEEHEVRYWTEALGVSEAKLRETVERVGVSAEKVREALGK